MAQPATAQTAAPDIDPQAQLDEIVVTAQRRTESSQVVPLAIQTISGDAIAKAGYTDVTDLQYMAPGVQYDPTQGAAFQIRGVGTTSFDFSNAKSVSVVVDDVVMDGQRANGLIGMVDIASVDVLMGPQGTLFGKNATSGVIAVTTTRPKLGVTALRGSASYGEHQERILNATVNLPLGQYAALRVSGFDQAQDGFGRNVTLDRLVGSKHEYGGRARLYLEPSDSFNLTLSGDYAHHWDSSVRTPVADQPAGVTTILNALGVYPGPKNADTADSMFGEIETEEWGASARVNAKLGDHELTSITAYRHTLYNNNTPADLTPINLFAYLPYNLGTLDTDKVSQEVHLASPADKPITYLFGLFYNRLEAQQVQYQWGTLGTSPIPSAMLYTTTGAIGEAGNASRFDAVNETMAAFGQVQFNLSERFRVSLGGRYTHDNNSQGLDYVYLDPRPITGFSPVFIATSAPPVYRFGRAKGNNFSFRVAPEFQIADHAMLYASYSTGYKPKGIAFVGNKYAPYEDETVKAWEIGLKSEWFDRRLRFNIDLFRSDFKDFQATILTKVPDGLGGFILAQAIGNAGGLRSEGVEASIVARPTPSLTLSASGTYTRARFTDYVYNATTDYTDTRLPNSPDWSYAVAGDYEHPVSPGLTVRAHADYAWRSKYWTVVGQPDWSFVPAFGLANARLSFVTAGNRLEFGAYARNLFDTYFSTGYQLYGALGLLHYTSPNARRTAGVFANFNF
ncbi:TonB-dependent receptor [Novosphingobium sp. H3SJ31-1]|uniref:TonB-dependent receptor n=2 Tax=Novosphingobium album (ex Liu et al. 2023) TaxID=3031130 RepID=A0ABT5WPS5_9SPHN|nr:TonB-dependent receptor [Novosphingobium album (ex Liu et al. 2023)]